MSTRFPGAEEHAAEVRKALSESGTFRRLDQQVSPRDIMATQDVLSARSSSVSGDHWSELLRRDVATDTLKEVFSRDIGGKVVDDLPEDGPLSWGDIARMRVTGKNIKRLFRRGAKGETPSEDS